MILLALTLLAGTPCGTPSCILVGLGDGGQVNLNGVLITSKGTLYQGDGGTGPALKTYTADLTPVQDATQLRVLGNQASTSTLPDVIIAGTNARDGGQPIVQFKSGNTTVAWLSGGGVITGGGFSGPVTGTAITATSITDTGTLGVTGVSTLVAVDAGPGSKVGGAPIGALVTQDGGTATRTCQFGYVALSTGAISVTFTRAFTSNPQCMCTHRNTTNSNACVIDVSAVPTTTAAKFAVTSGGSDVIDWLCCGDL